MKIKNMKTLGLLVAGTLAFCVVAAFTLKGLSAQSVLMPDKESIGVTVTIPPIEEGLYAKDKDGCVTKLTMFMLLLGKYSGGEDVKEMNESGMMRELFEKQYDVFRKKGVKKASVDMMKEHSDCMKNAPVRNQKRAEKYEECNVLHENFMDVLGAIKQRRKESTVLARYKNKKMELSKTAYRDEEDIMPSLAQGLYKTAKNHGYEAAVMHALVLSAQCNS